MDLIMFECPECGARVFGVRGWKQWCSKHERVRTIEADGTLSRLRLVEMEPKESVPA